jgi:hypothetical protein
LSRKTDQLGNDLVKTEKELKEKSTELERLRRTIRGG